MLVARFEEAARFIGQLDQGQDIAAGFKAICRENSISCAWINASGLIRNPLVSVVNAEGSKLHTTKGFTETLMLEGVYFCTSITGNVSLKGQGTDVRLYADCRPVDGGPAVCGVLAGGEVLLCEFLLITCADAALVRDESAAFSPWVQLQASAPGKTGASILEPMVTRPAATVIHQAVDEDEMTELAILEMRTGDYVDHPKFGVCRITAEPLEDKITIRLSTGKHVDLSLNIMKVLEPKQLGGRRIFGLEIKRKGS
jgi:predicted DNA-binding protein with PD1-like motif